MVDNFIPPTLVPNTYPSSNLNPVDAALTPDLSQIPDVQAANEHYLQEQYNKAISAQGNYPMGQGPQAFGPSGEAPTAGTNPDLANQILAQQKAQSTANNANAANIAAQQQAAQKASNLLGATNAPQYDFLNSTNKTGTPSPSDLGWQPQQTQSQPQQTQQPTTPDYLAQIQGAQQKILKAYGAQQGANSAVAEQAANIEEVKGNAAQMQQLEAQKAISTVHDAFEKSSQEVDTQMSERKQALQNYKDMLSPDKLNDVFRSRTLFEGKSTGQSILGALAIGLGGSGAAMQGGGAQNQALNIITKQLDKEQEARINTFKVSLAGQQNIAEEAGKTATMARQQYTDALNNALQNKALQIESIQAKLENMVAPYKGAGILANAQALNAQLEQKKQETFIQQAQNLHQLQILQLLKGMSEKDIMNLPAAVQASLPPEIIKNAAEKQLRSVPGYGYAENPKVAEDFNKVRGEMESGINDVTRLMNFAANYNKYIPGSQDRARVDGEVKFLLGKLREPMGFRTMTDSDRHFLEDVVGSPNDIFSLKAVNTQKLQNVLNLFKNNLADKAKAAGLIPQSGEDKKQAIRQQLGITSPNFK